MARRLRAVDGERREPAVGRLDAAPPSASAARRSGRPGGGGSTRRRRACRSGRPARPASRAAAASACRRCRRRSARRGRRASRRPVPRIDHLAGAFLDQRAQAAHGVQRRVRVLGLQVVGDPHRLGGHRAEQRGAVRDRLVGRRRDLAAQRTARRRSARSCVSPRPTEQLAGALGSRSAATQRPSAPVAMSADGASDMSAMLIPRGRASARCRRSRPGRLGTTTRSSASSPPAAGGAAARRGARPPRLPGLQRVAGGQPRAHLGQPRDRGVELEPSASALAA